MAIFLIIVALVVGAYIIAHAIRESGERQMRNDPEYKKEVDKIRDSLEQREKDNALKRETAGVFKREYILRVREIAKKYPKGIHIKIPFADWPNELIAWSNRLDREEGEDLSGGK